MIVTIDGPAASGKSTTAKEVAKKLGWIYLDTGAMYRAMALKVLKEKITLSDTKAIGRLIEKTEIDLIPGEKIMQVLLDKEDVTDEIRFPEVDEAVGPVCEVPIVRRVMVQKQREIAKKGNLITEGRDMGTVVFPDAEYKFFMLASIEERAKRRRQDLLKKGIDIPLDTLKKRIEIRDQRDSNRNLSPLIPAKDAIVVDTTSMTISMQVDFILKIIQKEFWNGYNN